MIQIGDYNKLKVVRKVDFGYYLGAETGRTSDDILLPTNNAPDMTFEVGDEVEAFIYRDTRDRVVATMKRPLAKVGDIAYLEVVASTTIGNFIDIGLEKDILVPMKEKLYALQNNQFYMFYIYLDKTGRIAATTDIDKHLETISEYKIGDSVKGTVYGFQTNRTAMIAVENQYKGIILNNEYFDDLKPGDILELNVKKIYEDGRLGLSPRKSAKIEITVLQEKILEYMKAHDNQMPFHDKSSPEDIYHEFHTSKNYFKNALGGLMKRNLVEQDKNGTRLK